MRNLLPVLLSALLLAASPVRALLPEEENTIRIYKNAAASVVTVTNIAIGQDIFMDQTAVPQGEGTGFVWDREGRVVTNYHVVRGGDAFMVTFKNQAQFEARVVGVEPRKDIAVLQIERGKHGKSWPKLVPIALGDSKTLQVGQRVIAIGNPFGLDDTLTQGIVSALGRQVVGVGGVTIHDMIQTDAAINPGNSGGPMLDSDGKLIGMNTMIYSNSGANAGIGFAVPVEFIRRIVPQLIQYGRVVEPGIGVGVLSGAQQYQLLGDVSGVVVRQVEPGSPAARAGLRGIRRDMTGRYRLGDIIVGIDGAPIHDYDELYNALDQLKVGDRVTVRTVRDGRKRRYSIVLVNVD
ncbi:MAG: trypsin-like peptidase domain-containing protein [Elusimicrobia bacterium]|nr:trypsin-like peptidase domain-containing protein [Elusimicrobiota bacterium]MDE2237053.1 trypsin-like peptidase domain-containing protein [Elusimicrobiota bacterium]MDE2427026.1 trypsin-like peptidase domain-containing protein [Elusimicrobiota bacterium]